MAFLNLLYNSAQTGMADSRVNKLMDDREHDWLAMQLAEERAAKYRMCDMFDMKKSFASAPINVTGGAASIAKAVHAANCDAAAIRNIHAAECDAEDIDTAQGR